uniref:Putative adipokinetic hormone-like protein n=1 Tax=Corethrella appendiculata TaxID=1370023 RepID=U5EY62_9DIPT
MEFLKFLSVILISTSLFFICNAQLTFTPAWGKRAAGNLNLNMQNPYSTMPDNCKTPVDSLMVIYRLIQSEAQKFLECTQK